MSSKLKYRPLSGKEFRLVTLLPSASASAQLELEIVYSNLDALHLSYVALSYTWQPKIHDDDDDTGDLHELILVDGLEISFHKNLAIAMRCIRTNSPQCIWADALCIDQSNMIERCSQVILMREIFSYATNVWAWLGREAKDSNLAMDFLSRLATASDEWAGNDAFQPSYYPTWEALRCLMSRNWWKRAWIIQEFALAQEVIFLCGDRRLSVQDFEAADRMIFVHLSAAKNKFVPLLAQVVPITARTFDPARNLLDLRRRLRRGERISALASLQMTRLAQATDPRDHLFAKLGLSGTELAELCPPNYDIEATEIWFAFLSTYIRKFKELYIICLAGTQPRTYSHLPSWLPDWGPSKPTYPLTSFICSDKLQWPYFDAANGTGAVVTISSNRIHADTVLKCQGLLVDTVDGVSGDRWAVEPRLVRQSEFSKNIYKTRSAAFQALCRTITANTNRMDEWGPPPPEFNILFANRWHELNMTIAEYELDPSQAFPLLLSPRASGFERAWRSMRGLEFDGEALRFLVEAGRVELTVTSTLKSPEEKQIEHAIAPSHPLWTAFEHSAGQACFERCLFTTVKGYFGIGPVITKPGDIVVILLGCKMPVLLRPRGKRYQLIGESYVDGIMYGEAMVELQDDINSLPLEFFELE